MRRKKRTPHQNPLGGRGRYYPYEFKLRLVKEVTEAGVPLAEVARTFGVGTTTLIIWVERYKLGGADALQPKERGRTRQPQPISPVARDAVLAVKQAFPYFGVRKVQDTLRRFEALGLSEHQIRRILEEQGLLERRPPEVPKAPPLPRRFERARPNQMWQSDIFTFLVRRHERVYLTAFMDDHSRYVVSHVLAHHQRGTLVLEALERAIADYGTPEEVLTDQGRQYTAWRGQTEFEERLRQHGIRHIKSRPQHPMTLGKVERFWKTLWDEFLSRTVFSDFAALPEIVAAQAKALETVG